MEFLTHLWLAILAAAAAVWIASAVIWMALGYHSKDWTDLPDEDAFYKAVAPLNLKPDTYAFPSMSDRSKMNTPECKAKWEQARGMLNIWPVKISMGRNMVLTFLVFLVVSALIAYLCWAALPHTGAAFGQVMRIAGTAGVLAYCFAFLPNSIWFAQKTRATLLCVFDGLIFGLVTGAVFAWLWPK